MENSIWIGVIGIIATIVFGFLSIDLFKRKRYPGKITYVKLTLIDLLNNIANNFDEIRLLHEDSPINKNLMYVKGALLNNGDIDINSKLTDKDISLRLPDNCKWLDIKPTKSSSGLTVNISKDSEQEVSFKFDLFRRNEFVQFEGLIESEDEKMSSDSLEAEMKFSHRIENTSKVQKKSLLSEKEILRKKRRAIFFSIMFASLLVVIAATTIFNLLGARAETLYFEPISNTTGEIYKVNLDKDLVKLAPVISGQEDIFISISEFESSYKATDRKLTLWQKFKEKYWLIAIQIGFVLVITLWELLELYNSRKLSKILNK